MTDEGDVKFGRADDMDSEEAGGIAEGWDVERGEEGRDKGETAEWVDDESGDEGLDLIGRPGKAEAVKELGGDVMGV